VINITYARRSRTRCRRRQRLAAADVAYGSKPEVAIGRFVVRFTLNSGHPSTSVRMSIGSLALVAAGIGQARSPSPPVRAGRVFLSVGAARQERLRPSAVDLVETESREQRDSPG
jgi:hypothetical protein